MTGPAIPFIKDSTDNGKNSCNESTDFNRTFCQDINLSLLYLAPLSLFDIAMDC